MGPALDGDMGMAVNGRRTATVPMVPPVVPKPAVLPVDSARRSTPGAPRAGVLRVPAAPEPALDRPPADLGGDRERMINRQGAVIALLCGILLFIVLGYAATAIVRVLPPRIQYVGQETVYAAGTGVAVEWRLFLQVHGESVTAVFYSERELVRMTDELGRRD